MGYRIVLRKGTGRYASDEVAEMLEQYLTAIREDVIQKLRTGVKPEELAEVIADYGYLLRDLGLDIEAES